MSVPAFSMRATRLKTRRHNARARLATKIFHIHSLQGFFNLSTWITALVGAFVLLGAVHLAEGRRGGRGSLRR
jgi:hypothetical protein